MTSARLSLLVVSILAMGLAGCCGGKQHHGKAHHGEMAAHGGKHGCKHGGKHGGMHGGMHGGEHGCKHCGKQGGKQGGGHDGMHGGGHDGKHGGKHHPRDRGGRGRRPRGGGGHGMPKTMGPMAIPGVKVAVSDIASGAAVTFTADAAQIPFLRVRVRIMAHRMNSGSMRGRGFKGRRGPGHGPGRRPGHGPGHGGKGGPGHAGKGGPGYAGKGGPGRARGPMPMVFTEVVDVPDGVQLKILAASADGVEKVRKKMRAHVERMQKRTPAPAPAEPDVLHSTD